MSKAMPYTPQRLWCDDFEQRTYYGDPTQPGDTRSVDLLMSTKTLTRRQAGLEYWKTVSQYWQQRWLNELQQHPDIDHQRRLQHERDVLYRMMTLPDAFTTPLDDELG